MVKMVLVKGAVEVVIVGIEGTAIVVVILLSGAAVVTKDEIFLDEAILASKFFKKVKSSLLEIFCAKKMTQTTGTMLEIFMVMRSCLRMEVIKI